MFPQSTYVCVISRSFAPIHSVNFVKSAVEETLISRYERWLINFIVSRSVYTTREVCAEVAQVLRSLSEKIPLLEKLHTV